MKIVNAIKKLENSGYELQKVREYSWVAYKRGCTKIEIGADDKGELVGISVGIGYPGTIANAIRRSSQGGV